MRAETLSNHPGDMLRETKVQERQASDEESSAYVLALETEAQHEAARRRKSIWKRLLNRPSAEETAARLNLESARVRHGQAAARRRRLEELVHQQGAGVRGEDALVELCSSTLSDDWLMFSGYRNRKGEADIVLIGPPGIWVVEVKNRRARLHVDGEDWRYEKFDNYGNIVESGSATDNMNRTWGRQARDVADSLAWWLERNEEGVPIQTAVILVHRRASLGRVREPGVDLVSADPHDLLEATAAPTAVVNAASRNAVASLIRRDHRYHDKRRKGSPAEGCTP